MARGRLALRLGVEDLGEKRRAREVKAEESRTGGGGVWFGEVLEVQVGEAVQGVV
jgi:hypothetical protein